MRRLQTSFFCAVITAAFAGQALADDALGSSVIARRSPNGLVIWDSAPVMAQIVKGKLNDGDANALLQRDALQILAKDTASFSAAKDVRVRIVYSKTGDINPAYGAATFVGIERYAEITLDHAQLSGDAEHWREAASGTGPLPAFTQLKVIGALPPR